MSLIEIFLIAIGLAMDAFAVSLCKGLEMKTIDYKKVFFIAFLFGLFQALMPLLGFGLGKHFVHYIERIDHWVAFFLLSGVGYKMLKEAMENPSCEVEHKGFYLRELILLAIATSIDALAIGLTFAMIPHIHISTAVIIIGIVTFVLCVLAGIIGNKFGAKLGRKAEFLGGILLIGLGLKILLEHLKIIHF